MLINYVTCLFLLIFQNHAILWKGHNELLNNLWNPILHNSQKNVQKGTQGLKSALGCAALIYEFTNQFRNMMPKNNTLKYKRNMIWNKRKN